jgi:hypothetical protein
MLAGAVLVALVLVAYLAPRRGLLGGCALVAVGLLWLVTNKSMEGRTIIHLDPDHGFTVADLAGVAAIVLGVLQSWSDVARRMDRRRRHP